MNLMNMQKPLPGKNICLISWIRKDDLYAKKMADSITFNSILEDLTKQGYSCSYFYDGELSN